MTTETYSTVGIKRPSILKDPDATLDYTFDWTEWLDEGENIAAISVTVEGGIVLESAALAGAFVTAWVSGGIANEKALVTCQVTTSHVPPRIDQRSIWLLVVER
jgi:hypothetical protein